MDRELDPARYQEINVQYFTLNDPFFFSSFLIMLIYFFCFYSMSLNSNCLSPPLSLSFD